MRLSNATLYLVSCLSLALFSNTALAKDTYNRISLRAEASTEIPHDMMQVTLYTEAQNSNAAELARKVTQTLNQAIEKSKQVKNVQISLGSRYSQPIRDGKSQKITAWRERAELRLESTDFASLSELTGELLQSLGMANMQFSVARDTRLQHENQLMQQAIQAFQERANIITQSLGGKSYKLVSLNLSSQGNYSPPIYRQALMKAEAISDSPMVEAGQSELTMVADGIIEIKR